MSDHYADHQPKPHGVSHHWPALCEGQGRWFVVHDLEGPAGVIFTGSTAGIGLLPFRATPIRPRFTQGILDAAIEGDTTPEHVFDAYAASESRTMYAGPVHTTDDLGAVADYVNLHNSPPPTR